MKGNQKNMDQMWINIKLNGCLEILKRHAWKLRRRERKRSRWAEMDGYRQHTPPHNRGNIKMIQTPLWKAVFNHRATIHAPFEGHEVTHTCIVHVNNLFITMFKLVKLQNCP